jgi:hypothetical protein
MSPYPSDPNSVDIDDIQVTIVQANPSPDPVIEGEFVGGDDEIRRETKALIAAIRNRAQAEMQTAGHLSREAYLRAVRRTRESIEQAPTFNPNALDINWQEAQRIAEKSFLVMSAEAEAMTVRVANLAKDAWKFWMNNRAYLDRLSR